MTFALAELLITNSFSPKDFDYKDGEVRESQILASSRDGIQRYRQPQDFPGCPSPLSTSPGDQIQRHAALLLDNALSLCALSLCALSLAQSTLIGTQRPAGTEDVNTDEDVNTGPCPQGLTFWGPRQMQTDIR